ncbi:BatA domain-containing protein [Pedobacter sp. PWIIR3]
MYLLYPIGLLALTALIVPLVIHLWNVKQGKTFKVGSVALLGEGAAISSKSLRITDWLLLFLRCLLLVLLVLIVCSPFIKVPQNPVNGKGWILVTRADLKSAYRQHKSIIDSLLAVGYELKDFDLNFRAMSLGDTIKSDTAKHAGLTHKALIKQLNTELPIGFAVYLFADQYLTNLNESLPDLQFKLRWTRLNEDDSVSHWNVKYGGKLYEGSSTPSYTKYIKMPDSAAKSTKTAVLIYHNGNDQDVRYLKAALLAIFEYSNRKVVISTINSRTKLTVNNQIVFWLSDEPVDEQIFSSANGPTKLFSYEAGKVERLNSFVVANPDGQQENDSRLHRKIVKKNVVGDPIWVDYYGDPLLTVEHKSKLDHYHLFLKFNQGWTDMVWENTFVKALMPLVLGEEDNVLDFGFVDHPADKRLRKVTLASSNRFAKTPPVPKKSTHKNISDFFWIAALIIFVLERWISLRKKVRLGYA